MKKRILIVDDCKDSRALLNVVLKASSYKVYSASNGQEALSLLNKLTHMPDIILLDTQMPVMDGFEFRKRQSKDSRLKHIPVIVTTGDTRSNISIKMRHPHGVLRKPFNIDFLLKSISECFSPYTAYSKIAARKFSTRVGTFHKINLATY